ncbi:MAG: family 10 glycosylhydrolase [Phycisphaerales bacterium]|nr:family 10 glycosylhydrolase [Phycisphaerales bacterium]
MNRALAPLMILVILLAGLSCDVGYAHRAEAVAHLTPLPSRSLTDMRGLWVTRWDYRTQRDVLTIIENAHALGITDLFFQVRGQADAFYRSDLEPWGEELLRDLPAGVTEPDFDPLALACTAAHRRGIRLHAWFNVMPLWRGTVPPKDRQHPYHTHPAWRLLDARGDPQPLSDHYVTVNPLRRDVQSHIRSVARDIARRYPIDGLHLDYVRFIPDDASDAQYPADALSHRVFRRATGLNASGHAVAYRLFIRTRITELVRSMRAAVKAERPRIIFSAAVWRDPLVGKSRYLQNYPAWIDEGLLDLALPMLYTDDPALFARELEGVLAVRGSVAMAPGIGVYKHDSPEALVAQMRIAREAGATGIALFGYESLFSSVNPEQEKTLEAAHLRKRRLDAVRRYFQTLDAR